MHRTRLALLVAALTLVACTKEQQNKINREIQNWTGTNGVLEVDNQLKVSGTPSSSAASAITDTWVTSKVKSSLLYESNLEGLDISVETLRGMVRLSGSVLSAEAKQFAISTARSVVSMPEHCGSTAN